MERNRKRATVLRGITLLLLVFAQCQGLRDIDGTARSAMGALQRDMKMLGDITICTGLKRYIACIEGSNLAITKAFWGRISDKVCPSDDGDPVTDCDGSEDTLPLVKGYCEGKRECKLEARHTLLQKNGTHHCPGVNKYLIVNYTCIPESKSVALCDSAETNLMCEAGWVIDIADIFWGRRSHAKYCGAEEGMECDSSDSAAKYIRSTCDGKRRCSVRADPALLDNSHSPCTTILKYLMINYVCKPPEKDSITDQVLGLLESKIPAEIKAATQSTGTSDQVTKETRTTQPTVERKYAAAQQTASVSSNYPSSHKGKKASYFTASINSDENDELSKALLGGVGLPVEVTSSFDSSSKKENVPEDKDDGVSKSFRHARAQKKTVMYKKSRDEVIGSKRDKEEIPLPKEKDSELKRGKADAVMGVKRDRQVEIKETKKPKVDVVADDGFNDEDDPNVTPKSKVQEGIPLKQSDPSVRSILARAKEVLQTLGSDNNKFQSVVEKRETITAGPKESDSDLNIIQKSDLVHDLTKDKAETPVIKDIIQQTASAFSLNPDKLIKKTSIPDARPKTIAGPGNIP